MSSPCNKGSSRQSGVVLVTALMVLVVLTLLMVSTMRTGIIEERMAGNLREWNKAFQAAEAALRDGEREIYQATRIVGEAGFETGCSATGLCYPGTDGTPVWDKLTNDNDLGWTVGDDAGKSVKYGTYTGGASVSGVLKQPRYIIEVITVPAAGSLKTGFGAGQPNYLYRITAVGFASSVKTRVMLQATYRQY